nr:ribonuclease TUDOR 1-like [Tanacetum cinerariifolium]
MVVSVHVSLFFQLKRNLRYHLWMRITVRKQLHMHLSESTLAEPKEFKAVIEERDTSRGKVKGQEPKMFFC